MNLDYKEVGVKLAKEIIRMLAETKLSGIEQAAVLMHAKTLLNQDLTIRTPYGPIKFRIANQPSMSRAQNLMIKEPETITWIDTFDQNDLFWDVGANIGVFSLYAANKRIRTLAFEPSSSNYYLLNENIRINKFDKIVKAYCVALNDKNEIGVINMLDLVIGGSLHSYESKSNDGQFAHGALSLSIDQLIEIFSLEIPNHIKVDVDGLEGSIINGARKTLSSKKVQSVLIELDTSNDEEMNLVNNVMLSNGFELESVGDGAESEAVSQSVKNHIFRKKK